MTAFDLTEGMTVTHPQIDGPFLVTFVRRTNLWGEPLRKMTEVYGIKNKGYSDEWRLYLDVEIADDRFASQTECPYCGQENGRAGYCDDECRQRSAALREA